MKMVNSYRNSANFNAWLELYTQLLCPFVTAMRILGVFISGVHGAVDFRFTIRGLVRRHRPATSISLVPPQAQSPSSSHVAESQRTVIIEMWIVNGLVRTW